MIPKKRTFMSVHSKAIHEFVVFLRCKSGRMRVVRHSLEKPDLLLKSQDLHPNHNHSGPVLVRTYVHRAWRQNEVGKWGGVR